MRRVEPFTPAHMAELELAPQQARDYPGDSPAKAAEWLAASGSAFTLRAGDGTVLLIAGLAHIDGSYSHAWAFMSARAGSHMRWLTRKVGEYLNDQIREHRRIEMFVRADFPQAARWATMLDFANEGPLAMAATDGGDMIRFARVNREWRLAA